MLPHSTIADLNVIKGLDRVRIGEFSYIGRFNTVTCIPKFVSRHYAHAASRSTELVIGKHSAITMRHVIDCNASVQIGDFTTIAGYGSQLLTHSIDLHECRQDAHPIKIGNYCFIGTRVVIIGGSELADRTVLGACSFLNKSFCDEGVLIAGVPAKVVKKISAEAKYFNRATGAVD